MGLRREGTERMQGTRVNRIGRTAERRGDPAKKRGIGTSRSRGRQAAAWQLPGGRWPLARGSCRVSQWGEELKIEALVCAVVEWSEAPVEEESFVGVYGCCTKKVF